MFRNIDYTPETKVSTPKPKGPYSIAKALRNDRQLINTCIISSWLGTRKVQT